MKTRNKLGLLTSLYVSQGLPYGFLTQAVPVLLRQEGASLTTIGNTSLLMAPWLLKVLWAPLVDRYWSPKLGRRRSWILPLQLLTSAGLMLLALEEPAGIIEVLLVATFITSLLAATQDIATDGLAVSLLTDEERGLGNGVQVAGYRLGMVVGGGALIVVFAKLGWTASFASMALVLLLATLPVWLWREPPCETADVQGLLWADILRFVRRPGVLRWLALLVAYKLGEQLGGAVTRPMLVDLGLPLDTIGWLGAADSIASLLGALVGGWLTSRLGRRRALVGFGLLQAVGVLGWALPALLPVELGSIAAVKLIDGFVGSMATVALFTAMMDACDPRMGGTDYTIQASTVLVAGFVGMVLGGRLADALISGIGVASTGYAAHFCVAAVLTVAGALAMGLVEGAPAAGRDP